MDAFKRKVKIRNFRDLEVWQLGMAIVREVYRVTKEFPKEERYGLVVEIRRSARSVPSNIAEGFNKDSNKNPRANVRGILVPICASAKADDIYI